MLVVCVDGPPNLRADAVLLAGVATPGLFDGSIISDPPGLSCSEEAMGAARVADVACVLVCSFGCVAVLRVVTSRRKPPVSPGNFAGSALLEGFELAVLCSPPL